MKAGVALKPGTPGDAVHALCDAGGADLSTFTPQIIIHDKLAALNYHKLASFFFIMLLHQFINE